MNVVSRCSRWYFLNNTLPYWGILAMDCIIVFASSLLVYVLEFGLLSAAEHWGRVAATFACYLLFYLVGFRLMRTYAGIIRYSSFIDLYRIGVAMLVGTGLSAVCNELLPSGGVLMRLPAKDLAFVFLLSTSLIWTTRVLVKYLFDVTFVSPLTRRIFIYGVRNGGISLAKSIRNQHPTRYIIEGFVAEAGVPASHILMGVRVYPDDDRLAETMKRRRASALFVSPARSEEFRNNQAQVNALTAAGIHIFMMPQAQEWDGKSELSHTQLKEVDIEDLLPRDKIEIDMQAVGNLLTGRCILITGAAGSIGSEMVRQIAPYHPSRLILVDQAETPLHDIRLMMARRRPDIPAEIIVVSITNASRMDRIFSEYRPEYVFHAAAYKHVPMMENNPSESVHNNVEGTRVVADLSVKYGTLKFVMVSTDKAVNPTNVMGCSKRICEIYVQSLDKAIKEGRIHGVTQFVTTRFGNVLGSNGSVIPLFKEQIKNGGPVTVTDPRIIRFFMLIPEACKLVLQAGTMGHGGEIYVFDMGKPVRIADLAERMIRLSGAKDVKIVYTGLRDGEKLYEEVLNDAEMTKPTYHPKIKVAAVREYVYASVCRDLDRLQDVSLQFDDMQTVKVMKEIVPEFKSRHSKYEALDQ